MPQLRKVWEANRPLNSWPVWSADVLPGNLVIVYGYKEIEFAILDANSGTFLWRRDLGDWTFGTPSVINGPGGLLYALGYIHGSCSAEPLSLLAMEPRTGRLVWHRTMMPAESKPDYTLSDGWCFVYDSNTCYSGKRHELRAVDLQARSVAWRHALPGGTPDTRPEPEVVAAGSRAVAVSLDEGRNQRVEFLDRRTGNQLFDTPVGDLWPYAFAIGRSVCISERDRRALRAWNLDTGREQWRFVLPAAERARDIEVLDSQAGDYLLLRTSAPTPDRGNTYLLDGRTGQQVMGLRTADFPGNEWQLFDGGRLVGAGDNGVVCFDTRTQRILWLRTVPSILPDHAGQLMPGLSFVSGDHDDLVTLCFVGVGDERLVSVLDAVTGEVLGVGQVPGGEPLVVRNGRVYAFGQGVTALDVPARQRPDRAQ